MPASTDLGVRVVARRGGRALVAGRAFATGETILVAQGVIRNRPSRLTLQVGPHRHLDVPGDATAESHPWQFLEHACRPAAAFQGRRLVALRALAAGDELTFDYETTEWELASPFACACGSMGCTGRTIRGFRHLSREERMRRLPQLRADLRRLVLDEDAAQPRTP